ncbi:GAF and ANTAR domain-containing protein [Aeromicrobium sp. Leaf350]|uniref:GAF and ANTAR domain-containing protein n=1 Tax=Aeromicrobium sp. Leaf350 TaxID=2876565 RepID=UPI001E4940BE|nr:GAF and ANTAR domain-containing protein [Aeromicrobium sp. Leaf350]
MDAARAAHALASATAALAHQRDVHTGLLAVMDGACEALEADTAAILVSTGGHLEMLAATSHRAADLELHQLHLEEGPCVEAISTRRPVVAAGDAEITRRWPQVAPLMLAADLHSVIASPVSWHDTALGGLNLFRHEPREFSGSDQEMAAAFASLSANHLLHAADVSADEIRRRVDGSFADRIVIEQAKGVIAEMQGSTMAEAYDELVRDARDRSESITDTARRVLTEAQRQML